MSMVSWRVEHGRYTDAPLVIGAGDRPVEARAQRAKSTAAAAKQQQQVSTNGIAAIQSLPFSRLLHRRATNEVVQIHIDLKRNEDGSLGARLIGDLQLQRELLEYIIHVVEGRLPIKESYWIRDIAVSAWSKEWPLKDAVTYMQDGIELKPHPVKYAFLVRFLTPDQLQTLQDLNRTDAGAVGTV